MGMVGEDSAGQNVLDIFSGTGSLGLEALSRGASHCTFIEKDRSARQRLEQNLANLQFTKQSFVLGVDAVAGAWLKMVHRVGADPRAFNLIFVDPPYRLLEKEDTRPRLLAMLNTLERIAAPNAVMVLRTAERVEVPPIPGWTGPDSHTYGSMILHFFTRLQSPS